MLMLYSLARTMNAAIWIPSPTVSYKTSVLYMSFAI